MDSFSLGFVQPVRYLYLNVNVVLCIWVYSLCDENVSLFCQIIYLNNGLWWWWGGAIKLPGTEKCGLVFILEGVTILLIHFWTCPKQVVMSGSCEPHSSSSWESLSDETNEQVERSILLKHLPWGWAWYPPLKIIILCSDVFRDAPFDFPVPFLFQVSGICLFNALDLVLSWNYFKPRAMTISTFSIMCFQGPFDWHLYKSKEVVIF